MPQRILVISDIHANVTALQSVINDAGSVDGVWCLGDLVGYGPDPADVIHTIRALPNLVCLVGNHDAGAIGQIELASFNRDARITVEWMQKELSEDDLAYLKSLPEKVTLPEFDVTLAHGSPRNPVWEYLLDTFTAQANFKHFKTKICLVGHTHLPVAYYYPNGSRSVDWKLILPEDDLKIESRSIINPGSVGQPRDHDRRASYAILYPELMRWEIHRVEYDIASVQERIRAAGLPERHAVRLAGGW